jgi:hypothetical protein
VFIKLVKFPAFTGKITREQLLNYTGGTSYKFTLISSYKFLLPVRNLAANEKKPPVYKFFFL